MPTAIMKTFMLQNYYSTIYNPVLQAKIKY
jgi:hypothetical protein